VQVVVFDVFACSTSEPPCHVSSVGVDEKAVIFGTGVAACAPATNNADIATVVAKTATDKPRRVADLVTCFPSEKTPVLP
jgi:hypothetical protein